MPIAEIFVTPPMPERSPPSAVPTRIILDFVHQCLTKRGVDNGSMVAIHRVFRCELPIALDNCICGFLTQLHIVRIGKSHEQIKLGNVYQDALRV